MQGGEIQLGSRRTPTSRKSLRRCSPPVRISRSTSGPSAREIVASRIDARAAAEESRRAKNSPRPRRNLQFAACRGFLLGPLDGATYGVWAAGHDVRSRGCGPRSSDTPRVRAPDSPPSRWRSALTSSVGRFQLSEENAYRVSTPMASSGAASTTRRTDSAPA